MNALSATVQALLADTGVTDIVGTKIEPITAPENQALPCIVVNQITNMDERLLAGEGQYPDAVVRITCLARTKTEALTLGDAVISRLRGLSGTFAGMAVTSFLKEEVDETDANETYDTYRRTLEYCVRYRAA